MSGWNRWEAVNRPTAIAVLALLLGAILYGLADFVGAAPQPRVEIAGPSDMHAEDMIGDHALYAKIAGRVSAGEPYYSAAAAEHRANGYPLKPFVTVRLPTAAYIFALFGRTGGWLLVAAVGVAAILAWRKRLISEPGLPGYARFAALLMAPNMAPILMRDWVMIHEVLAGALIALAFALYRPERPWAALLTILAAILVRETALPVAIIFGCFALYDRRWPELLAWTGAGAVLLAAVGLHASTLSAVLRPDDLASPGWSGMGGWHTYVAFVHQVSALRFLPSCISAILVPIALLGWSACRSRLALVVLSFQFALALILMAFARANNFYWACLVVPTLHMGLIFAPAAIKNLVRACAPRFSKDHLERALIRP
ncbi:hypothetical protein G7077_10655 [Sphingomonas piscis]|uniref:DUF2029 domain-containing protein n=1 Tax=Sphingomonas piscis TaxID=2714943 RepID=A0A6G7YRC8_9SPHN|nr:hypothetical protein [Sphingomonas piscis]QIK79291.1 hypothetical protein G7077_10655 [Sphingomonas piscis]